MPYAAPIHKLPFSPVSKRNTKQLNDKKRGNAQSRGYDHRWQKARLSHIAKSPLCVKCQANNRTQLATVVDHIIPHRGDYALFWDTDNWQSLCTTCHNKKTRGGL